MERRISHFYTRSAKHARTGPSPFGKPLSETLVAGLAMEETAARTVEAADGAVACGAAPMGAGTPIVGVVAGVAEMGVASGEAVEARRTTVEVTEAEVAASGDAAGAEVTASGDAAGAEVTAGGDAMAAGAKTGAVGGDTAEAKVMAGGDAVDAEATASGDVGETEATSGDAVETTTEAVFGSSSSFSYEDSEETISETRPKVGLDEAGPSEVP